MDASHSSLKLSYDGRNKEPITLPVKFPLLLAQGVEGIAVGLSSKILPHNFNELCDASISYLRNEEFGDSQRLVVYFIDLRPYLDCSTAFAVVVFRYVNRTSGLEVGI